MSRQTAQLSPSTPDAGPASHRHRLAAPRLLALAVVLALVPAACGSDDSGDDSAASAAGATTTTTPVDDPDSDYCGTVREIAILELSFDEQEASDPAAFEAHLAEATGLLDTSLSQAPEEIHDDVVIKADAIETTLLPLLDRYGYDPDRITTEGTPEEQAILEEPPADVAAAQANIDAYGSRVCGTEPPPAADVVFEADASAETYCEVAGGVNETFGEISASLFDPAALEASVTNDDFRAGLDAYAAAAPEEIAADVEAFTEALRTPFVEVLERFDYDVRVLILEGTPEDRSALWYSGPTVAEHAARVTAYEQQVCGA